MNPGSTLIVGENPSLSDQFFNLISDVSQFKCERGKVEKI